MMEEEHNIHFWRQFITIVCILHDDWIDKGTFFIRGKNCLGCRDENDITSILNEDERLH